MVHARNSEAEARGPMDPMRPLLCVLLAALILLPTGFALAEDDEGEEKEPLPNEGLFEFGAIIGLATELGGDEESGEEDSPTDGCYGVEIYYRGWEHFGAGMLFEFLGVELERSRTTVFVLGYHPVRSVRIVAGAGLEWEGEVSNKGLFRLGGGYLLRIGKGWELMPELNLDLVEGGHQTLVYGITLAHEL